MNAIEKAFSRGWKRVNPEGADILLELKRITI